MSLPSFEMVLAAFSWSCILTLALRQQKFSTITRRGLFIVAFLLGIIPVYGLPLVAYPRGIFGDFSFTSVSLLSAGLYFQLTDNSLYEEKVMDDATGQMLNPNMEFYRLAGIGDIGEIVVHMMTGPGYDERGVIGLGEPPVISPGAAIANAVANAIGVRVPTLPLTPDKVLAALEKGGVA